MKIDTKIMYVIRGLLAMLCGLTILILSSPTIYSLAMVFTAYCLLEGLTTLLSGLKKVAKKDPRWYLIGESVVNLCAALLIFMFAGVLGFMFPRVASILLLLLVSGRIILIGLIEILVGIFRKTGVLFRVPIGLASIIFGLVMIYLQDRAIFVFVLPLGIYGIVAGVFLILVCLKIKDADKTVVSPEA